LIARQYIGPYDNVFEPLKLFKGEGLEKQEIVSVDEEWLNDTNESDNSPIKNEDFKQLLINI